MEVGHTAEGVGQGAGFVTRTWVVDWWLARSVAGVLAGLVGQPVVPAPELVPVPEPVPVPELEPVPVPELVLELVLEPEPVLEPELELAPGPEPSVELALLAAVPR